MIKLYKRAQLEQHKIFQNFLTSPALAAANAPPLPTGATPKLSPLLEPNESYREGNGTPLQYSCLESPMNGGAW